MMTTAADDFHALVINFNDATAVFNATHNAFENVEVSTKLDEAINAIETTEEVATTYKSAIAAMQLAIRELENFDSNLLPKPLIKGALAFFSGWQPAIQILEAQDILSNIKNLNEAIFMAAHGIGESRHMNAITSVADIIESKLAEVSEMLDAAREEI